MLESNLELARRIESAEATVARAWVRAHNALYPEDCATLLEIGGGVCRVAGTRAPTVRAVGLGLDGPLTDDDLGRLIEFIEAHSAAAEIRLAPFADPTIVPRLLASGFSPGRSEISMARELTRADFLAKPPDEYSLQGLHPARTAQWVQTIAALGAPQGAQAHERVRELYAAAAAENFLGFVVILGTEIVAVGGLQSSGDVMALFGFATLERFRRSGLQRALIEHSLAVGFERGFKLARLNVAPGTTAQRNAQRTGFRPLYTPTILARPAAR